MSRRGGQLSWGGGGSRGFHGGPQSSGYGRLVLLVLIVLGVLGLSWFLISKAFGGGDCNSDYCPSEKDIEGPEGFELASRIFEINAETTLPNDGKSDLQIDVPLLKPSTETNLTFYRYLADTETWEPVTPAILDGEGKVASATFSERPAVLAVVRRNSPGGAVAAYIPSGQVLHPDAVGRVTIVHPLDFFPSADGTVGGELTPIKSDGTFEVYPVISANAGTQGAVAIVQSALSSPAARSNHIQQILKKANDTGVKGIDIAYLDLQVTDRSSFTLFIGELYQALHAQNKQLTLTLPAPMVNQNQIDEGAYDWAALAKSADLIKMAPFRNQARYRLDVPRILTYLTTVVQPTSKLVLTVSPYATEGSADGGLQTMTLAQAMLIATKMSVSVSPEELTTSSNVDVTGTNINRNEQLTGIRWQDATASVAFSYKQPSGAGTRTVWLENFFSIGFKLEYISQFKLGGVGIEDASKNENLGNIWPALVPYITSGQPILLQPNGDDLKPRWAVSRGNAEDTEKGVVRWTTPPEPGTYAITLTVSDGVAVFENTVEVNVKARDLRTPVAGAPAGATPVG